MQLSKTAREAGIGELTFEVIDTAPKEELAALCFENLGALRRHEKNKAIRALGIADGNAHKFDENGFYLNGEQIIGYGPVTREGDYFKQTLALNYLEGAA